VEQHEREIISARIKDALSAKKRRGFKLGTPNNLTLQARKKGGAARAELARNDEHNRRAIVLIKTLRQQGHSFAEISTQLNDTGHTSSRGNSFHPGSVERLFKRLANY
jgi:DNA invertase Pin-like site-specific DNA recombinase